MGSLLKRLAGESVIYGISGIVSKMITIFLVPVYTRLFLPADYGIMNLVNTTFALISMLAIFGMDNSVSRWYFDTNKVEKSKCVFATWFWFYLFITFILGAVSILGYPIAKEVIFSGINTGSNFLIWLLPAFTLLVNILPTIIWNWFRLQQKPVATTIFSLSQSLTTIALTLLLVVQFRSGILGVYLALMISGVIYSSIAFFFLKGWINVRYFDRKLLFQMLRFAAPLVPATIAFWIVNATDAYFILAFRDKAEVGLFSVGASVASGIALFTGAFQQAWGPFAYSIIKKPDSRQVYADVFLIFCGIGGWLILAMFLFSSEALMILATKEYLAAHWVASILSVNIIIATLTYIASIATGIVKDNKPYAIGILTAAVMTVILDIIFIPKWGKEGSALATVLAHLILPIYVFFRAQKKYPIPYKFSVGATFLIAGLVIGISAKWFFPILKINVMSIIIKTAFLIAFGVIVFQLLKRRINIKSAFN